MMAGTEFGIAIKEKDWKRAKDIAFSSWYGSSYKQKRLIVEMLELVLQKMEKE